MILGVVVFNFFLIRLAPGDPASIMAGEAASSDPAYVEQLRRVLHAHAHRYYVQDAPVIAYPPNADYAAAVVGAAGIDLGYTSPLTTALDSAFGTLTFSRASANASVIDHAGLMQFALSGEARFYGARRVCNLIADTESLTTGWTLGANTTKAAARQRSPNHGRLSAWTVTRASGSGVMLTLDSASYRPGTHTFSAWLWGDGSQTYTLTINATTQTVTPSAGGWVRCSVSASIASTTAVTCSITNASAGAASFTICDPQMEYTHGQATPAPGEYVPRGVAGFPSALLTAGVDGVRYFDTVNPWSVSSGVATKVSNPAAINPETLKGLLLEPGTVNQFYSSGDLSTAQWAKTGSTTVNATPLSSTVLGATGLWKVEEASATQGHRTTQSWRGTNPTFGQIVSASAFAKAAERNLVYLAIRQMDNSTFRYAFFNLSTGVVASVTTGCSASIHKVGDVYRISLSASCGSSGSTAPLVQVGVTTAAGTDTYAGTAGYGAYFGALQFEDADVASSYVGDTGSAATLTRAVDSFEFTNSRMSGIGITLGVDYTPFFKTDTPLKDNWWYVLYTYTSSADRAGFGLRPGALGGFYDGGEKQWFFDLFPNLTPSATSWDGVEVLTAGVMSPAETLRVQWSLATTAVTGASNQSGAVGGVAATLTGDTPRPTVNTIPNSPRTWRLGRGEGNQQRGPAAFKNLFWLPEAKTAAEMIADS